MSSINHFRQNRAVHLARRDGYFEAVLAAFKLPLSGAEGDAEESAYRDVLFLLRVARLHARFCVRSREASRADEEFARFVALLTGSVKAVLAMLELRNLVLKDRSFNFLGSNQATLGLQAEEYQRRAAELVRALRSTLELAEESFAVLKVENEASLEASERERYERARAHVAELMERGQHRYPIAPSLGKLGSG